MTFEPGRWYFLSGYTPLYLVKWDSPFLLDFEFRNRQRTGGSLTVSLLLKDIKLPYGLGTMAGPWFPVPDAELSRYRAYPVVPVEERSKTIMRPEVRDGMVFSLETGVPNLVDSEPFTL